MPWVTALLDLPADRHVDATTFWLAVTGYQLSSSRGTTGEFATLQPSRGDAHLRVQRIDEGPPGIHLDVHVPDLETATDDALARGAVRVTGRQPVRVLRSPGGLVFCLVGGHEGTVAPAARWGTHRSVVDQLSIDVPAAGYEQECAFWAGLLRREVVPSDRHEEFRFLPGSPLRILLQRLEDPTGPTRAHLGLATDDREAEVSRHESRGARAVRRATRWTVLVDPAGLDYCVTARDPR